MSDKMAKTNQTRRYKFSDSAEILVGNPKAKFIVHKSIIGGLSPFLDAALSSRWNPLARPLELPEDDPKIFDGYLHVVYEGKVDLEDVNNGDTFVYLVELYVMADKFGDTGAANMVMNTIIDLVDELNQIPGIHSVTFAFDNSPDGSPLRNLLVDLYVNCGSPEAVDFDSEESDPPVSFMKALAKQFGELTAACNYDKKIGEVFCRTVHDNRSRYQQRQESLLPVRGKRTNKNHR